MRPSCPEANANGAPCRWKAWRDNDPRCLNHLAQDGDEEALALLRERAEKSNRLQRKRASRRRVTDVRLRSDSDRLALLERAALDVLNGKESPSTKANALARLATSARELVAGELDAAAAEFKKLLAAHPELARRMKAVP